jgi:pimeloyl-[acyl-carrier protein] synthase
VSAADRVVIPVVRAIGTRPKLSKAIFRFATYNPFDPGRYRWPYPIYDAMSGGKPVVYSRLYQDWTVLGRDEVLQVLRSSDVTTSGVIDRLRKVAPYTRLSEKAMQNFSTWMLFIDPPMHSRFRGAVSRSFTPKRVALHESRIQTITEELLDSLPGEGRPDVMNGFASRLPVYVIADILGVPRDRFDWLHRTSSEIAGLIDILRPINPTSMNRRFEEMHAEFTALIKQRRVDPSDDLISAVVHDSENDLTDDELVSLITLLMFAGHETTTSLLGNSIVALAKHPEQRELLAMRTDIIDNAIEELLRYDSPVQMAVRQTTAPVQAGTTTIPAGANVGLIIGAANRDLRWAPDADQLRLDRPNPSPISFGSGIHHCLGAALSRIEMRVALPAFLQRFGEYRINQDNIRWKQSSMLRGPTHLPLEPMK